MSTSEHIKALLEQVRIQGYVVIKDEEVGNLINLIYEDPPHLLTQAAWEVIGRKTVHDSARMLIVLSLCTLILAGPHYAYHRIPRR